MQIGVRAHLNGITWSSEFRTVVQRLVHLYIECGTLEEFWRTAKTWFTNSFGVVPILTLKGYRLFGMEKEPPNDLINIFYRCVRYSIFFQRKKSLIPSLKYFVNLVRDELKIKYGGIRFQRYAGCPVPNRGSSYPLDEKGNGVDKTIPERIPT